MKGKLDDLPASEWDFRPLIHECPSPLERIELQAAICYEYARESSSIRKLAEEYAGLPRDVKHDVEHNGSLFAHSESMFSGPVSEKLADFEIIPYWNCVLWPKFFPHTPWLDIPPYKRIKRAMAYVSSYGREALRVNQWNLIPYPIRHPVPEMPLNPGARFISSTVESLLISVDWTAGTNDDIINTFEDWVRKSRPEKFPSPRSDRSRKNVTVALLTRLGVMRLLNKYSYENATKEADKVFNNSRNALLLSLTPAEMGVGSRQQALNSSH